MESSRIKACQIQVRKVAQRVVRYVWREQEIIDDELFPKSTFPPEITDEFIGNLCRVVWYELVGKGYAWADFSKTHLKRMTETPYLFTNYVAFAVYLSTETISNARVCFLEILSLVIHFALYCWEHYHGKFLNTSLELFCAFFDKDLCTKFEEQGSWKSFGKFIENQINLKNLKENSPNSSSDELFPKPTGGYVINGVVLENIAESQVENHQQSVSFANSVRDKIKEVYEKEFKDVLKDFLKIDEQTEKLYCETVGVACNGMAGGEDQSSLQNVQDEALKNISSLITPEHIEDQAKVCEDSDLLETRDIESSNFALDPLFKLENTEKALALLGEMMNDIAKISELIKFICEEK